MRKHMAQSDGGVGNLPYIHLVLIEGMSQSEEPVSIPVTTAMISYTPGQCCFNDLTRSAACFRSAQDAAYTNSPLPNLRRILKVFAITRSS